MTVTCQIREICVLVTVVVGVVGELLSAAAAISRLEMEAVRRCAVVARREVP